MLVPLYLLCFVPRAAKSRRRTPSWRLFAVALATAGGMLFAWLAPGLPLDDLATRLRPGVAIDSICAGGESDAEKICLDVLLPQLSQGSHWVVLARLEDESLLAGVDSLNRMALAQAETGVWVLSADELEVQQAFYWQAGPVFEVREVPAPLMRPLYRTLPRSFRLQDGKVLETVNGLPPAPPPPD